MAWPYENTSTNKEVSAKRSSAAKAGAARRAEIKAKLTQCQLEELKERERSSNARALLCALLTERNWKVEFVTREVIDMATLCQVSDTEGPRRSLSACQCPEFHHEGAA